MGDRGRKSTAELSVLSNVTELEMPTRSEPPEYLTEEQANEWREIVASCPVDQFPRGRHASLASHCTHIVQRRKLAQKLEAYERDPEYTISGYKKLADMHAVESAAIDRSAVRLGLAYSTAYEKRGGKQQTAKKPWQG